MITNKISVNNELLNLTVNYDANWSESGTTMFIKFTKIEMYKSTCSC